MKNSLELWMPSTLFKRDNLMGDPLVWSRDDMTQQIHNLFDDMFDGMISARNKLHKVRNAFPKADVYITEDKLCIELACAGMTEKDIKVEVGQHENDEARNVTVSGGFKRERVNPAYYAKELTQQSFSRSFYIPDNVVNPEPDAVMKDGMLTLTWQLKKEEKRKPEVKRIEINTK